MHYDDIKRAYFAAKSGILKEESLVHLGKATLHGRTCMLYRCPCGSNDAIRFADESGPTQILNCFATRQQWLIKGRDVYVAIRIEEEKYLRLLQRAPVTVAKVVEKRGWSEETIAYLMDTHGIDRETAVSCRQGDPRA